MKHDDLQKFIQNNKGDTPTSNQNNWNAIQSKIYSKRSFFDSQFLKIGLSFATLSLVVGSFFYTSNQSTLTDQELVNFMFETEDAYLIDTYDNTEYISFNDDSN